MSVQPVSRSRIVAAAVMTALLAGCGISNPSQVPGSDDSCRSPLSKPLKVHSHSNGLQLSVSETCQVTTTATGFVIEPADKDDIRYPFTISIQLLSAAPQAKGNRLRNLGSGRILWYSAMRAEAAGSGDPDWEVIAVEHVGNHWIQFWEHKQDELQPGEVWEVARGLTYVLRDSASQPGSD